MRKISFQAGTPLPSLLAPILRTAWMSGSPHLLQDATYGIEWPQTFTYNKENHVQLAVCNLVFTS